MEFFENLSVPANIQDWVYEWFYVVVLLLSAGGVLFFGFKIIFRLVFFVLCLWTLWWAASRLGLIDETVLRYQIERSESLKV